jgi:hypothetical protein
MQLWPPPRPQAQLQPPPRPVQAPAWQPQLAGSPTSPPGGAEAGRPPPAPAAHDVLAWHTEFSYFTKLILLALLALTFWLNGAGRGAACQEGQVQSGCNAWINDRQHAWLWLPGCLPPACWSAQGLSHTICTLYLSFFLSFSFFFLSESPWTAGRCSQPYEYVHTYLVHAAAGDPAVIPSQHAARQQIQHGSERARRPAAQAQAAGSTACGAAAFPLLTPPARCGPFTSRRCARASPLRADSPAGACLRGWAAWAAWGACHRCAHPKHFFHLTSPA